MSQHTFFISDIHLDAREPKVANLFFRFIEREAPKADALYVLGDLFEMWVGDDDHNDFIDRVKEAFKELVRRGVPVYLMRGNRDFLLGERFARETGALLLSDPTVVTLYGRRILLMHGDSLCVDDKNHMRFRRFSQNRYIRRFFLAMPLSFRRAIGHRIRQASQQRQKSLQTYMDVNQKAVEQAMMGANVALLVHGHTHRPAIHTLYLNDQPANRVVLGAWHDQADILAYSATGGFKLVSLRNTIG